MVSHREIVKFILGLLISSVALILETTCYNHHKHDGCTGSLGILESSKDQDCVTVYIPHYKCLQVPDGCSVKLYSDIKCRGYNWIPEENQNQWGKSNANSVSVDCTPVSTRSKWGRKRKHKHHHHRGSSSKERNFQKNCKTDCSHQFNHLDNDYNEKNPWLWYTK